MAATDTRLNSLDFTGWTVEQIDARLNALSERAEAERRASSHADPLGGSTMQYMTDEEMAEMHALKLALPSNAQLVQEAAARVRARILERNPAAQVAPLLEAFSDTQYLSAQEKRLIVKDLNGLISVILENGTTDSAPKAFTKRLYAHLSSSCGHIAHYDRSGFWAAQLADPSKALAFFEGLADPGLVDWTTGDYKDVNGAINALVTIRLPKLRVSLVAAAKRNVISTIEALAREAGLSFCIDGITPPPAPVASSPTEQQSLF